MPHVIFDRFLRMIRPLLEARAVAEVVLRMFIVQSVVPRYSRATFGAGYPISQFYPLVFRRMRLVSYRLTPCDYVLDLAFDHLRSLKAVFLPKYTRLLRYPRL